VTRRPVYSSTSSPTPSSNSSSSCSTCISLSGVYQADHILTRTFTVVLPERLVPNRSADVPCGIRTAPTTYTTSPQSNSPSANSPANDPNWRRSNDGDTSSYGMELWAFWAGWLVFGSIVPSVIAFMVSSSSFNLNPSKVVLYSSSQVAPLTGHSSLSRKLLGEPRKVGGLLRRQRPLRESRRCDPLIHHLVVV